MKAALSSSRYLDCYPQVPTLWKTLGGKAQALRLPAAVILAISIAPMSTLKPCHLIRRILPKPWGGNALREILGLAADCGEGIGETWEVYDRPDGSSAIRGSDLTLRDLMVGHREDLLGAKAARRHQTFPLLIKYIDSREALSIQVHPGDQQAAADGDSGKSEAWIVLAVGPEGRIIRGLRPGVSCEDLAANLHSEKVVDLLQAFCPVVGDVVLVPAGTVHSIGPDVVVFEVQQNSDITYRLFDWGRPRELQIEKGLRAVVTETELSVPGRESGQWGAGVCWLLREDRFRVRRCRLENPQTFLTEGSVKILSVLSGSGALGWRSGGQEPPIALARGDTVLVPACSKQVYVSPIGGLEFFWTDTGEEA